MKNWIAELKKGEEVGVVLSSTIGGDQPHRGTVKRITKTMIIVDLGWKINPDLEFRFQKKTGSEPGSGWHKNQIHPLDEGFRKRLEVAELKRTAHALAKKIQIPKTQEERAGTVHCKSVTIYKIIQKRIKLFSRKCRYI